MNILIGVLIVVEILVSILLTLIILVQPSKSRGGLGGALGGGGGMSEQLFGARTGNVLTKATIVLATLFLANTVALAMIYSRDNNLVIPEAAPAASMSAPTTDEAVLEAPEQAAPAEEVAE